MYLTYAPDGSGRLFIVEQIGRIRIYKDGKLQPTPFLDIRSLVVDGGERGLLSVAFPPTSPTTERAVRHEPQWLGVSVRPALGRLGELALPLVDGDQLDRRDLEVRDRLFEVLVGDQERGLRAVR